jgi:hypothetical protein
MAVGFPLKTTYANGDVYSASDVNDTNGTINLLQTSTLSYQAGKNATINGGFDVWQRSTSATFAGTLTYPSADRFFGICTGTAPTCTMSRQTADTTGLTYGMRFGRNSGQTNTGQPYVGTAFESLDAKRFAGQTVTLSFYVKAGANAPLSLTSQIRTGTGTDQSAASLFSVGWTGGVNNSQTNTVTTTMTRYTQTVTLGSTVNQIMLLFTYTPTGTAGANEWFQVEGVQLELGSYATTFSRTGGTIQGELAACQRYYEKSYRQAVVPGSSGADTNDSVVPISSVANNESYQTYRFAVTKRTDATITTYSYNGVTNRSSNSSGTDYGANSADPWRSSQSMFIVRNSSGSSMTIDAARFIYLNWVASAEL